MRLMVGLEDSTHPTPTVRNPCDNRSRITVQPIDAFPKTRQPGKEAPGMDRRTALILTMLLGGWLPRGVFAQGPGRRTTTDRAVPKNGARRLVDTETEPESSRGGELPPASEAITDETAPSGFPTETGQRWQNFDIARYASLDSAQSSPQNAIIEWIFRRTGTAPWHGEKLAVLNAGRTRIRAFNDPKTLEQTAKIIERFTDAESDFLTVRVRFVAAVDTRWRYAVYSRLTAVGSGSQGQQIWTLSMEDAAYVLAQMQVYQGFRLIADEKVEMVNGQTFKVKSLEPKGYTGGMARESANGLGYQPKSEQLNEGVTLQISPLLTYDGDAVDAAIDLSANTVKSLHRTKVIAPREIGPAEITIDVPEVVESRLNQTVKGWPLGQTLLISAGIQPGILQNKGGFMNLRLPGTTPSGTELLVFLDVESASRPRRAAARNRDRDRDRE